MAAGWRRGVGVHRETQGVELQRAQDLPLRLGVGVRAVLLVREEARFGVAASRLGQAAGKLVRRLKAFGAPVHTTWATR